MFTILYLFIVNVYLLLFFFASGAAKDPVWRGHCFLLYLSILFMVYLLLFFLAFGALPYWRFWKCKNLYRSLAGASHTVVN